MTVARSQGNGHRDRELFSRNVSERRKLQEVPISGSGSQPGGGRWNVSLTTEQDSSQ